MPSCCICNCCRTSFSRLTPIRFGTWILLATRFTVWIAWCRFCFTTKKGGSGIGLAQTYQILQWHYGSVDFESLDGQGAIFRLRLPVAETRAESLKEAAIRT